MSSAGSQFDVVSEWVGVSHTEKSDNQEVFGYAESNKVFLEGVRFLPKGRASKTLMVYMHPTATFSHLPVPRELAAAGLHVLCAEGRYARNDTALVMEKLLRDYGAFTRHAKEVWGYEKLVLVAWSGGGSLTSLYQSQAENPTIVDTPAGDPVDLGELIPGDAFIFHAANLSRSTILLDSIDPSVLDEANPAIRNAELDLYDPRNLNRPPYSPDYIEYFRAQQLARIRRRTDYVKELLAQFRAKKNGVEFDRIILTHRTMADPRWLDSTIDPNDRQIGTCFMGSPELANVNPAGIARYATLRGWLSHWSGDDTRAHADVCARDVTVPVLAIENTADTAIPQPHTSRFFSACASADKTMFVSKGANHYYTGQPDEMREVIDVIMEWLRARDLIDA